MPDDPTRVAIDWDSISSVAPQGGTLAGVVAQAGVGETIDAEEFLARAIPATAEIDQMSETGKTVQNARTGIANEVFAFVLTVQRDGQAPYETKLLQGVPAEHKGTFGPGATVPIGISPDDPDDVAIDWRELERQRRT
jgi:hypothetical protein